jgi:DNA transposition AAA+ family ATPase
LQRQNVITSWHAHQISAGKDVAQEIDTHLQTAQIILLLTSADFIASEYYWNVEVKRAMERHDRGDARVIPLLLLFTGREALLNRLYESLRAGKTTALTQAQAITGLGGIGKTQTALEYAYRYQNDYDAILWVKADSSETLLVDLVSLAHLLQLPERTEQETARIVNGVKRC